MSIEEKLAQINGDLDRERERRERRKRLREGIAVARSAAEVKANLVARVEGTVSGGYLLGLEDPAMSEVKAFLPNANAKRHGTSVGDILEDTGEQTISVVLREVRDDGSATADALRFLEAEERKARTDFVRDLRGNKRVNGVVVKQVTGAYILRLGRKAGFKIDALLPMSFLPFKGTILHDEEMVAVTIQEVEPDGKILLTMKEEEVVKYPRGYRPPTKPVVAEHTISMRTMGAKQLRDHLAELRESRTLLTDEEKAKIKHSLEKRSDWPVREILKGNADWHTEYLKVVGR